MNRENLSQYLLQMGFDQHKATEIIEFLLKQFTAGGQSVDQAFAAIGMDIQSGGDVYRRLNAMKTETHSAMPPLPDSEKCPNCGHPRSPMVPGISRPGECVRCGIIFDKFKVSNEETKLTLASQHAETDSPPKSMVDPPAQPSKQQGFLRRHKWVTAVIVTVLVSLILAPIIQSKYKSMYKKSLAAFDQQLKMDNQEEFETSLDNLKLVIETAAIMVTKRGWSKSDINWFCKEAMNRCDRFLGMMNDKAAGQSNLFGFKVIDIQDDLGSGMHMLLLSIRDKDARLMALMHSAFSVNVYAPNFNPDQLVNRGAYTLYDPARYKGSSQRKLVRDGKEWVLRERTEKEKTAYKNKQTAGLPGPPQKTQAQIEAEENFKMVADKISLMQFSYRRTHNGACCGNLQELVAYWSSTEGRTVSQETTDMINSGAITIKVTLNGRLCELVDLRRK